MEKLVTDVKNAVANLKLVALNLHVPLDTSTVDKALDALLKKVQADAVVPAAAPKVADK